MKNGITLLRALLLLILNTKEELKEKDQQKKEEEEEEKERTMILFLSLVSFHFLMRFSKFFIVWNPNSKMHKGLPLVSNSRKRI
jgi:hypothetical protein